MSLRVSFIKTPKPKSDTAVACVYEGGVLSPSAQNLDKKAKGLITSAVKNHSIFKGKHGQTLTLALPKGAGFAQIVLLGLGKPADLDPLSCEKAGGKLVPALRAAGAIQVSLFINKNKSYKKIAPQDVAAYIAGGAKLRAYHFHVYKSKKKGDKSPKLTQLDIIIDETAKANRAFKDVNAGVEGTLFARDLMNDPPNMLYPDSYAKLIQKELKPLGVSIEIMDEKKLKTLKFGAVLAVGMGSKHPPRVVIMRWNGASTSKSTSKSKSKKAPLGFIGKGVTFDTGGISIKPSASMDEMKMDMGGSAAVVGLFKTLAMRKAKVDAIGIVGLTENMPSDRAYRPGDIITSMSGKTIEILNTDAEGRLVLCDCMTYMQQKYKPRFMIDLATLTGAMMVALGHEYAGAFVNDNKLWDHLEKASETSGEKLWRMPLDEAYAKAMDSKIADLNNLGNIGRYGGACTAAGFLWRFVESKKTPWAHLDIAGMMMQKGDKDTTPAGGVGYGVRLLDRLVADHYE